MITNNIIIIIQIGSYKAFCSLSCCCCLWRWAMKFWLSSMWEYEKLSCSSINSFSCNINLKISNANATFDVTHMQAHTHARTHTQTHTHACTSAHIQAHTHTHARTHPRTHTYTNTHTPHTRTHTHTHHKTLLITTKYE